MLPVCLAGWLGGCMTGHMSGHLASLGFSGVFLFLTNEDLD